MARDDTMTCGDRCDTQRCLVDHRVLDPLCDQPLQTPSDIEIALTGRGIRNVIRSDHRRMQRYGPSRVHVCRSVRQFDNRVRVGVTQNCHFAMNIMLDNDALVCSVSLGLCFVL